MIKKGIIIGALLLMTIISVMNVEPINAEASIATSTLLKNQEVALKNTNKMINSINSLVDDASKYTNQELWASKAEAKLGTLSKYIVEYRKYSLLLLNKSYYDPSEKRNIHLTIINLENTLNNIEAEIEEIKISGMKGSTNSTASADMTTESTKGIIQHLNDMWKDMNNFGKQLGDIFNLWGTNVIPTMEDGYNSVNQDEVRVCGIICD